MSGFFAELKRRKVFRVAVVYAATAFVVLQAADIMLPRLGVPEWGMSLIVAIAVLGFPLALVLAWALEVTPEGIRRQEEAAPQPGDGPAGEAPLFGRRALVVSGALVAIGVALAAAWSFGWVAATPEGAPAADPERGPVAAPGAPAEPSIAVLAFADLSPEGDQEYFADGIAEEILNALVRVPDLKVAGRASSFYFKGREEGLREVGAALGVAHILDGAVRKQGDRVRITARLVRGEDGFHLWSESYDGDLSDVFDLQERIARAITDELQVVLHGEQRERLVPVATRDPEAYALYLEATGIFNRRHARRFGEAMQKLEQALARDPAFARARSRLAALHFLSHQYVGEPLDAAMAAAERHARAALERDPTLAEPHAVQAQVLVTYRRYTEAYDACRRALALDPDDLTAAFWFATLLRIAGYGERSADVLDRVLAIDPLLPNALLWRAQGFLDRGDLASADRLLRRADEVGLAIVGLGLSQVSISQNRTAEAARQLAEGLGALMPEHPPEFAETLARGVVEVLARDTTEGGQAQAAALARIDDYLAARPEPITGGVLWALVWLGHGERALVLGQDRPTGNDALFIGHALWASGGDDARRSSAFAEFARRSGLVDLWEAHGPPDGCRRVAPRDYSCS